jgi:hypothetical protein
VFFFVSFVVNPFDHIWVRIHPKEHKENTKFTKDIFRPLRGEELGMRLPPQSPQNPSCRRGTKSVLFPERSQHVEVRSQK